MTLPPNVKSIDIEYVNAFSGDLLTVACKQGLPPGTRLQFELALPDGGDPMHLQGKITGVKRDDAHFLISIRLHSVTREQRALLCRYESSELQ